MMTTHRWLQDGDYADPELRSYNNKETLNNTPIEITKINKGFERLEQEKLIHFQKYWN